MHSPSSNVVSSEVRDSMHPDSRLHTLRHTLLLGAVQATAARATAAARDRPDDIGPSVAAIAGQIAVGAVQQPAGQQYADVVDVKT